jgi:hypothetical protein
MSLPPVILPRKGLYQQRKHLTEQPMDIDELSAVMTTRRRESHSIAPQSIEIPTPGSSLALAFRPFRP